MTKNKKVPFAILSCFTIAFAIQAILKLCKVFVFEKALNWEIFAIIDNSEALSIIYYSCLVLSAMYCLSFAMTGRWYSKKWYHYVIMIVSAKNDLIDQLRTQLNFANLQASQVAQTASIREGQIDAVNSLYNRLDTCPVGTTPVYGRVPIFTCNGGCGCQSVQ